MIRQWLINKEASATADLCRIEIEIEEILIKKAETSTNASTLVDPDTGDVPVTDRQKYEHLVFASILLEDHLERLYQKRAKRKGDIKRLSFFLDWPNWLF